MFSPIHQSSNPGIDKELRIDKYIFMCVPKRNSKEVVKNEKREKKENRRKTIENGATTRRAHNSLKERVES